MLMQTLSRRLNTKPIQFSSLIRQLHMYGFTSVGEEHVAYTNPLFVRDNTALQYSIRRKTTESRIRTEVPAKKLCQKHTVVDAVGIAKTLKRCRKDIEDLTVRMRYMEERVCEAQETITQALAMTREREASFFTRQERVACEMERILQNLNDRSADACVTPSCVKWEF